MGAFSGGRLAVTRTWGLLNGANPVMYIDISPTGFDWLTNPISKLIETAEAGRQVVKNGSQWTTVPLANSPVLRLLPFFEQMGKAIGRSQGVLVGTRVAARR